LGKKRKKKIMSITPWSFSRLKSFEQCPKQFYHLKMLKDYTERETEAMRYGTEAHLVAEEYIRDSKPIPPKFTYMEKVLKALNNRRGNKFTEMKLGLTEELKPCKFDAEEAWFRGIVDLVIIKDDIAWIIDYKTGKNPQNADTGQLELMALAIFEYFPDVDRIHAGLLFTVKKKFIKESYQRDQIDVLWRQWRDRHEKMKIAVRSKVWNPHPSGLCYRHCVVTECVYNGANR
jgi:RecB family exonuclease